MVEFTPTEQRLLHILSDGDPHMKIELLQCIDEYASDRTLYQHISNMRKKLRPQGEDILCQYEFGRYKYRHVRLLRRPIYP